MAREQEAAGARHQEDLHRRGARERRSGTWLVSQILGCHRIVERRRVEALRVVDGLRRHGEDLRLAGGEPGAERQRRRAGLVVAAPNPERAQAAGDDPAGVRQPGAPQPLDCGGAVERAAGRAQLAFALVRRRFRAARGWRRDPRRPGRGRRAPRRRRAPSGARRCARPAGSTGWRRARSRPSRAPRRRRGPASRPTRASRTTRRRRGPAPLHAAARRSPRRDRGSRAARRNPWHATQIRWHANQYRWHATHIRWHAKR